MVGEHIRALKGGRWNHAIDCGDETVIHLAGEDAAPSRVRRSYRPEFVAGAEVVEVVTHRERTFPASEVVARAYSRISDPGLAAMFRDSEAFAEWCVTGRLSTPQNTAVLVPGVAPAPLAARGPAPAQPEPAAPGRRPTPPRRKSAPARRGAGKASTARAKPAGKAVRKAARKPAARAAAKPAPRAKATAKKVARKASAKAPRRDGAKRGKR